MVTMGKGLDFIREAQKSSVQMLRLKNGESTVIRILVPADELISVYEHTENFAGVGWRTVTCLGEEQCPLCQAGKRPGFVTYVPVLDRKDNTVKIFKASKKVAVQLIGLVEEYGDLTKRDYKVYRQGERQNTVYQFLPRDPEEIDLSKYELPDVEKLVAPKPKEYILSLMSGGLQVEEKEPDSQEDEFPF